MVSDAAVAGTVDAANYVPGAVAEQNIIVIIAWIAGQHPQGQYTAVRAVIRCFKTGNRAGGQLFCNP